MNQKSILRFVNSKDIRRHLEKIDYPFTSLEAAWMIYQCRNATIEEKHRAWRELIDTMPDCSVPKRLNTAPQESLHTFLQKYMDVEDRLIAQFYRNKNDAHPDKPFVYLMEQDYGESRCLPSMVPFTRFDAIRSWEIDEDAIAVHCTKTEPDQDEKYMEATFTPQMELLSLWMRNWQMEKEEDEEIYFDVFDGLWFHFPTPFEKGDIVWDPRSRRDHFCGGPFVVEWVCPDSIGIESIKENVRKNGDCSDMSACGYFVSENGIYGENMCSYMDLEYFDGELTGTERALIPLSNFVKGKIDVGLFARAYHQIMTEEYGKACAPQGYLKNGLALAGLAEEEHIRLWLDDIREAPEGYVACKSVNEMKQKIVECEWKETVIDVIDCDHDLGEYAADGGDGIALLDWLAERKTFYPILLHTANPVGRENMKRLIERYWYADREKQAALS